MILWVPILVYSEVYGDLGADGYFDEKSSYKPNSPYSASKAASDHLVRSWGRTYNLPVITTNCSNNYGANQFPEKLLPNELELILMSTITLFIAPETT